MKGLKIIPVFVVLLVCTYVGVRFVEANRDAVVIQLGSYQSQPAALGLVVLTSVLIGMIIAGLFCSIELIVLMMQNRRLRKRVSGGGSSSTELVPSPREEITHTNVTGSFEPDKRGEDEEETGEYNEPHNPNRFNPL